ncbi:MBL fold metallo-hydrolase [Variovorax sp. LT2P21]|uniref:MBL fold metallo-hydrolase n=1 Tax=Variovorax sp. LT2P21 TaxID=3443731 RepID=UPI003F476AA8
MTTGLPRGVTVFERGWLSSNNVLLDGDAPVLVDSGYVTHAAQTVDLVERELDGRPLALLLNTHLHSDHCGGNAALQERYASLRTEIPPGDADAVAQWDEAALSYRATGQQCPRFRAEGVLLSGQRHRLGMHDWEVHSAPGHDPHSVVLFEPESRTLISADALWGNGFGVVFPELVGEPSFDEVAATLDLIEALNPRKVIPGHGGVFGDTAAALDRARRRLDGLMSDPGRHARHAFKVLIKFQLLDAQCMPKAEWRAWRDGTSYLQAIHKRFFPEWEFEALADDVLEDLIRSGAARRSADTIHNV